MLRKEVKLVSGFALAGALMPFGLYWLYPFTLASPPLLSLRNYAILASALCPVARWIYSTPNAPFAHDEVVRKLLATIAMNALIYAAMGVIVAAGLNGRAQLIATRERYAPK